MKRETTEETLERLAKQDPGGLVAWVNRSFLKGWGNDATTYRRAVKLSRVVVGRTIKLADFESLRIDLEAEVGPRESRAEVVERLKSELWLEECAARRRHDEDRKYCLRRENEAPPY